VTTDLRSTVLALSSGGFENLCKRLLTELGLVQLRTVGQAGDRGIDVEGHLRVNPVVSFRVGVQCKLYSDGNKVTPRQIREFQGALGPFDRGIFMTTSVFTQQAEEQATSPGYKPIDLIDGERLVELLQEYDLGIKRVTLVDDDFFVPFR
jgi:restriction system protein